MKTLNPMAYSIKLQPIEEYISITPSFVDTYTGMWYNTINHVFENIIGGNENG